MVTSFFHTTTRRTNRTSWWKVTSIVLFMVLVLVMLDFGIGNYQEHLIETRREAKANLEKMAWFYVRADLEKVIYTPKGGYQITLWMENLFPEYDLFLMIPTVRIFLQVGTQWQEVPAQEATVDPHLQEGRVINLKDRITVDWVIADNDMKVDYFELLEGYMHVQIHNKMFISPEAEPKEHLVERNDYYYIHLKPIDTKDETLRQLHQFPGPVPIFIPMPPH